MCGVRTRRCVSGASCPGPPRAATSRRSFPGSSRTSQRGAGASRPMFTRTCFSNSSLIQNNLIPPTFKTSSKLFKPFNIHNSPRRSWFREHLLSESGTQSTCVDPVSRFRQRAKGPSIRPKKGAVARPPAERRSELTVAAAPSPLSQRSHGISGEVIREKI